VDTGFDLVMAFPEDGARAARAAPWRHRGSAPGNRFQEIIMNTTTTPAADVQQPERGSSGARTVALAVACAVVGAAVTAGLVLGLGGSSAAPAPSSPVTVTQDGGSAGFVPTGGSAVPAAPAHHVHPPTPPAPPKPPAPSAAISTLQRELGQLNYYEGPVTGIMNAQTTQAITYLQRDAGLPQTGTMNAATEQALVQFLAHGNNQMGS
jgi:Putative peptidoglycan binding domain